MFTSDFWEAAQDGDIKKRNEILMHYQDLISFAVRSVASNVPRHISRSDLTSNGQFGLLEAIDRFDPNRGFKFETFAMPRIKGAILDSLRDLDWVPRSVRSRERILEKTTEELLHRNGRQPTIDEVMEHSGLEEHEIIQTQTQVEHGQVFNLDMPLDVGSGETVGDLVTDMAGEAGGLDSTFDLETMVNSILDLGRREYATVTLHYYLGETLAQIGTRFGVTESRACQIHTDALLQIRDSILS